MGLFCCPEERSLRKYLGKLGKIFGLDDACVLAGAALVAAGLWQIYRPAAFIAVGGALIWWGIMTPRSHR